MKGWLRGIWRFGFRFALVAGALAILALGFLTQTSFGREQVLKEVLTRAGNAIQGEIEVRGISSLGLLKGVTFRDVIVRGEDGRTFLQADSIQAGLSGPALLRGDLVLTRVHLWNPRVTLEQLPGQERMNVVAIFGGGTALDSLAALPDTASGATPVQRPGGTRTILLRSAQIHGGSLDVLLPLSAGQAASGQVLTAPAEEGRPALRRMTFRDIDLDLDQAILTSPGEQVQRFEIRHLSFVGEVWPQEFSVTGLDGEVRREGKRLLASLRTLELANSRISGRVEARWGDDDGLRVSVQGEADPVALQDLAFIEDRLPRGKATGPFGLELSDDGVLLDFQGAELTTDQGKILARGGSSSGPRSGSGISTSG